MAAVGSTVAQQFNLPLMRSSHFTEECADYIYMRVRVRVRVRVRMRVRVRVQM